MSLDTRKAIVAMIGLFVFGWLPASQVCNAQQIRRGHEPVYRIPLRPGAQQNNTAQNNTAQAQPTQHVGPSAHQGAIQANPVANRQPAGNQFPVQHAGGGGIPGAMQGGIAPVGYAAPIMNGPLTAGGNHRGVENGGAENGDSHPLDPALTLARRGLDKIRTDIQDYTCYMVKRERVNGRLSQKETMYVKIRNRRQAARGDNTPFSIYMRFVAPDNIKGREVIWVENHNDNRMVAHDVGLKGFIRANLDPDGRMAMSGQRYPVYEAGIENLVVKLIEVAERDRKHGDCKVEFFRGATVQDRTCTVIRVTHPEKREPFDFYQAEVFIDDELQIPIRYVAYSWPETKGGSKRIEEEYTYLDVKVNVGLTDRDFDPDNPKYDFP